MSKRALVTGCCGFIGSNLVRELIRFGWTVEGVDDLSSGDIDSVFDVGVRVVPANFLGYFEQSANDVEKTLVINGDFTHENILSRIKSGAYDVVFHLAAEPSVGKSVEFPVETHETNVFKTIGLFDACKGNVEKIVFASSAAVYGDTERLPIRETQATQPQSPYALQKLQCEQYAELSNKLYDTDIISLRLFNVFGPGQQGDSAYSNVISAWCNRLANEEPLRVDGSGNQTRDFCYIDNVVYAFRLVAETTRDIVSSVYNVGSGACISNNNVLGYLKERYPSLTIEQAPAREGDVTHSQADITRINQELNYNSRVQFYEGLEQTLKWWGL